MCDVVSRWRYRLRTAVVANQKQNLEEKDLGILFNRDYSFMSVRTGHVYPAEAETADCSCDLSENLFQSLLMCFDSVQKGQKPPQTSVKSQIFLLHNFKLWNRKSG